MSFADLHHADLPLLLPNAWDVPSALAFVEAGFEAIGTTSFGVASSIGRPDGDRATRDANLRLARQLADLGCYVSIDIEDGYSEDADEVAEYVANLPADGVNLEDSIEGHLVPPDVLAAKISAVKMRRPELFVNARIDTYWFRELATVEETVARAARYVEAGADGVFVPRASDPDLLRELTARIPVPLNVLAIPGTSLLDLAALGVRRVSTGSLPYRAAVQAATDAATAVRDHLAVPASVGYDDLQARLVEYAGR
ncbi:isocitrate lyase/PEP mutase family protein [Angustibacter luteus]|uniref:Isocitrate lyase/phosphoenolpyruvate mutase family protein n=1 Tax=Angustibacter luteus TaxID=658456 RepID=A0ABW1JF52_9ACTN